MKRVILTVTGTAAGVAALLSFKTEGHPVSGTALPSAGLGRSSSLSSAATTPAASSPVAPTPRPSTSTAAASATTSKTYTGSPITTRYGIVQVKITVSGNKITNVAFARLDAFDQHSADINSFAGPQLLRETLNAQSAHIDTVSGATYTSDGFTQSLQSALDRAGLP